MKEYKHPVFDSMRYPWHLDEARQLHNQLAAGYPTKERIIYLYKECGAYGTEIRELNPDPLAPGDLWRDVLDKLAEKLYVRKLLDKVLKDTPPQQIKDAIAAVEAMLSSVDPRKININLVIVDRGDFRQYLELLAEETDPAKVIIIKGESKSGKTYSRHLFEDMARQCGAQMVFLQKEIIVTLTDVLETLFDEAGDIKAIPPGNTTVPGWYSSICRALKSTARDHNKILWIAIDDLGLTPDGAPFMDVSIREFFDKFVSHMSDPGFRKQFRLMLINYPPGKQPTGWYKEHIKQDELHEQLISPKHIEEYILNWCSVHNKQMSPADAAAEAGKLIQQVDNTVHSTNESPRLERMQMAVLQLLNTL